MRIFFTLKFSDVVFVDVVFVTYFKAVNTAVRSRGFSQRIEQVQRVIRVLVYKLYMFIASPTTIFKSSTLKV